MGIHPHAYGASRKWRASRALAKAKPMEDARCQDQLGALAVLAGETHATCCRTWRSTARATTTGRHGAGGPASAGGSDALRAEATGTAPRAAADCDARTMGLVRSERDSRGGDHSDERSHAWWREGTRPPRGTVWCRTRAQLLPPDRSQAVHRGQARPPACGPAPQHGMRPCRIASLHDWHKLSEREVLNGRSLRTSSGQPADVPSSKFLRCLRGLTRRTLRPYYVVEELLP